MHRVRTVRASEAHDDDSKQRVGHLKQRVAHLNACGSEGPGALRLAATCDAASEPTTLHDNSQSGNCAGIHMHTAPVDGSERACGTRARTRLPSCPPSTSTTTNLLLYTVTLPLSNVPAFLLQRLEQGRSPGLSRVASRFPLGMIAPNSRRSGCRVKLQRRRCHSTDDRFIASAYMYKCTQSTLHSKIFLLPTY